MKWNHLKAYCRKKHYRQSSGSWVPEGPRDPQQTDFVSVTQPCLLRGENPVELNQEQEQWNGMEETNFLFFKYSNTLFFLLSSKQELEPAHAAATRNCGGSAVLRRGFVVRGNGQHGAQHGLTCPWEAGSGKQLGTTWARWCFVAVGWTDLEQCCVLYWALGNHSQGSESLRVTHKFLDLESQKKE